MLERRFLPLLMLIAVWLPVQFFATWQSMARAEMTPYSAPAAFMHAQVMESSSMTVQGDDSSPMSHSNHHEMTGMAESSSLAMGCGSCHSGDEMDISMHHGMVCAAFCLGVPPAVSPLQSSLALQPAVVSSHLTDSYQDFIPGVQSPPPLTVLS